MAEAQNAPAPEEQEEIEEHEKVWGGILGTIDKLLEGMESFSQRTFYEASNYKTRQKLEKTDPGKQDFRKVGTHVRKLRDGMKRQYNHVKPRDTQPRKSNGKTGFNRLVLVDAKMRKFMKLNDWGLVGEVEPDRVGVCTHAIVTRVISNYVACMKLLNPLNTSTWAADDALKELFSEDWEECGVNPKAVKYTELQKLIARHIQTVKEGMAEHRSEEDYRKKLNDDGEYGKATREIRDLRSEIADLSTDIIKHNDYLKTCRVGCTDLVPRYEKALRDLIAQFEEKAKTIKAKCSEYDFPISPEFPTQPRTVLSA